MLPQRQGGKTSNDLRDASDVPSVWETTVPQREKLHHEKHEGQLPHVSGGTCRLIHAVFTQAATFPSDFTDVMSTLQPRG